LPVYVYLFNNVHQVPLRSINAKLVLLKSNEEELFFKGSQSGREAELEQYMQGVKTVLTDMLDMSKPFKPFDDEACAECTFKNLCHV
jgi:hypothetical protein